MQQTKKTRAAEAAEKKRAGTHNCAQAVLCTYADRTGLDETTARLLGLSFAAGMGNAEGTCGALVGAGMVWGLVCRDKGRALKGMKQMMTRFEERNSCTRCRQLKGLDTGMPLRACPDCVADACEFLEELLEDEASRHTEE